MLKVANEKLPAQQHIQALAEAKYMTFNCNRKNEIFVIIDFVNRIKKYIPRRKSLYFKV